MKCLNTVKRTERGWPGHYICADLCDFRRNTLLESSDGRSFIVSSVGACRDPQNGNIVEIGYNCYYETRVFETVQNGPYIEADVTKEVSLSELDPTCECGIFGKDLWKLQEKYKKIGIDNAANDIHEHAVNIVTKMLQETSQAEELQIYLSSALKTIRCLEEYIFELESKLIELGGKGNVSNTVDS